MSRLVRSVARMVEKRRAARPFQWRLWIFRVISESLRPASSSCSCAYDCGGLRCIACGSGFVLVAGGAYLFLAPGDENRADVFYIRALNDKLSTSPVVLAVLAAAPLWLFAAGSAWITARARWALAAMALAGLAVAVVGAGNF